MILRIINNTNLTIYINDICALVPLSNKGCLNITIEEFTKSTELVGLIKDGKVLIFSDDNSLLGVEKDKENFLSISGTTIWNGVGKTKPINKNKKDEYPGLISSSLNNKIIQKKYKIRRVSKSNVSIEILSIVLRKNFESVTLDEHNYQHKEIQDAIESGIIKLVSISGSKVGDNGEIIWEDLTKEEFKDSKLSKDNLITLLGDGGNPQGKKCFWEGPIFDAGGYANMNRQYLFNLTKLGVATKPSLFKTMVEVEDSISAKIIALSKINIPPKSPKIYATTVPGAHNGFNIAYTMIETEKKIHHDMVKSLKQVDEIWVPSEWNKETFLNGGVKKPIHVMPLGIDDSIYCPKGPEIKFNFDTKSFVFLSVSTWIWRKGFDVLLKAYSRAFNSDDDVSLVVFTKAPFAPLGNQIDFIKKQSMEFISGEKNKCLPHFVVVNSIIPVGMMPNLYRASDAFALFSRGEGWGFPYCEATACGLPVVGSDHGGQKMFLNNDNSFLVKPDSLDLCHKSLLPMSNFYKNMAFVDYSDKAIDECAEKMREVFEDRILAQEKAKKCRENLISNYTWEKASERVNSRLKEI